jgi:glycosyltransferase involved in cell wall biosynthesis
MEKSKQGKICAGLSAKNKGESEALSKFGPRDRGLILFVVHDAHVGGAQHVARITARWLLKATRFQVKVVILSGGGLVNEFLRIAPVLDLSSFSTTNIEKELMKFLGEEPCVVFINSVVSARFLEYWKSATPVIAFIHEMGKSLSGFPKELDLLCKRASLVIAGGNAVRDSLAKLHGWERVSFQTLGAFVEDDLPLFAGSARSKIEAKRKIGIDEDSFLVMGCGVIVSRKSPQEFVRVAGQVVSGTSRKVKFLWVGGGPDLKECQELARNLGLEENVHFVGYQADIQPFLHAADLFLLPSKEDPFPLVSLYAGLASCPVICFAQAGGIPDVISQGGGRIVPFGDLQAMAEAVLDYVSNEPARSRDGQFLRDFVREQHTVASGGPSLLHWIREACHLRPHVSVVVPSYNHAAFLEERLQSIAYQTYQDFELILLDDSSTDGSCVQLEAWVLKRVGTRLLHNASNSGSAFGQWQKGFSLARGSMVWIAEADDSCDPRFLENLVPEFDDRNVFLGYVKSVPIDSQGAKLGDYDELYLNRINPGRWLKDYRATDYEEANQGLGIANCIPNVSSVLIRTFQPEAEFFSMQSGMKICGDWLFYLRAMRGGMVSYCAKPLNMHRRHQRSVTGGIEGTQKYFSEFCRVREFVSANYRLEELTENRIAKFDQEEAMRFKVAEQKPSSTSAHSRTRLPAVLFVASDLSPGGGQMFIIRLANEWALRGGRAILLSAQKYPDHSQVTAKISPRVALFSKSQTTVSALVDRFRLELVHSAIWWADDLVRETIGEVGGVPWFVTMHGCHETLLDYPGADPQFHHKIKEMLNRVDAWVYTATKNQRLFQKYGWPAITQRIDNGVDVEAVSGLNRQSIGLSDSALILCLASRALFEKGWLESVAALEKIRTRGENVELLLIGEGPAAESIKKAMPPGVKLLGQVANLQDYMALADIVLLPSYFVGESLPLVLLEAMALGKPFVATAVGEIPKLVESEGNAAGILIPLVTGRPDINDLVSGIERLADPKVRQVMGKNALARHKSGYTLNIMVDRYNSLYRKCIANRRVN